MPRLPNESSARRPAAGFAYHRVAFETPREAAAFVAALSRFLDSPRGRASVAPATPGEVWSAPHIATVVAALYLSDGALAATALAFGAPQVEAIQRGDELPLDCAPIIEGLGAPAWGLLSAEQAIAAARHTPVA